MKDADGYIVYRSFSKNGTYKRVYTTDNPKKNWYINTNRKSGQIWWYKVRGYQLVDGKKVFSREVFKEVLEEARKEIIEQVKKVIPGEEKKAIVDERMRALIRKKVKDLEVKNGFILWLVEKIIELIPLVTQLIYNFLKEKVEAL
jgi:hypothetical protein